jgi:[ribosomal protein S18]-alanine N-acetyltransferase
MMEMKSFKITKMSQKDAELVATWKYDGIYSFYNAENDKEDLEELLNESDRGDNYYSVHTTFNELIGFFTFTRSGNTIEMGLGLAPPLTGNGLGLEFVNKGIHFIESHYSNINKVVLSVATFNKRAIKLYEKVGFSCTSNFMQHTNGSQFPFQRMEMFL